MMSLLQKGVLIFGSTLLFGKWLSSVRFVFSGADLISEAAEKAGEAPFAIPALAEYQVLVTSKEGIRELTECDEGRLSFHKACSDSSTTISIHTIVFRTGC